MSRYTYGSFDTSLDIENFLSDNWLQVLIGVVVFALIITLLLLLIPAPLKEGYVIQKMEEELFEWNTEEEEAQYRTEFYVVPVTTIDSEGNSHTTLQTHSRLVYDHTDIVSYHYVDDHDYILIIESKDNMAGYNWYQRKFKKERERKSFKVFVQRETYNRLGIEHILVVKEEICWWNDNITKTEISRRNR